MTDLLRELAELAVQRDGLIYQGPILGQWPGSFISPTLQTPQGQFVELSDLLKPGHRVIIGGAGQGKTLLLTECSFLLARQFLAQELGNPVPVFVRARDLAPSAFETITRMAHFLASSLGHSVMPASLTDLMRTGQTVLLLDGLDEAPTANLDILFVVRELTIQFPMLSIIASSRPTTVSQRLVDEGLFTPFLLGQLSDAQLHRYVFTLVEVTPDMDRSHGESFLQALQDNPERSQLARNPLLLNLLWALYQEQGSLPQTISELYHDATDYVLNELRFQSRPIPGESISLAIWHKLLEYIAISMFANRQHSLRIDSPPSRIEQLLLSQGLTETSWKHVIAGLERSWLLIANTASTVTFIHRSFEDYYVARAMASDPSLLNGLSDDATKEFLSGPVEYTSDRAEIFMALIRAGKWKTVTEFLSTISNQDDRQIIRFALEQVLGPTLLDVLKEGWIFEERPRLDSDTKELRTNDLHSDLLTSWNELEASNLQPYEKGSQFEGFVEALFRQLFLLVDRNILTREGELDLVFEAPRLDVFWIKYAGYIPVECKNWSDPRPLSEVNTFFGKVDSWPSKLAFVVSASGFTKDALESFALRASNQQRALIVPISGEEIHSSLKEKEDFELFIKRSIRRMELHEKF